jgi:hypothetical protein
MMEFTPKLKKSCRRLKKPEKIKGINLCQSISLDTRLNVQTSMANAIMALIKDLKVF